MTFQLSPGVYSFEQDNSQVISNEAQNIVAQVGAFKRGTLKKKRVSTRSDFMSNYTNGTLDRSLGYSSYVAYTALENCRNLVIKRVVNNAKYAGLSVIKAGATETESVQFLNGSTTDYENGGKEIKAISISGPLPTGYGLSVMLKNVLSNDSVEIVSTYSSTSSSNETLEAFAKLIQAQLDKWGQNGKAKVNRAWSGAPKQQIQKMTISRSMIEGESIEVTLEDLYLGKKTFTVEFEESNEKTLDALRLALNNTGYVFAYLDSTDENTLVITALSAGPDRIAISTEQTSVAEEDLTVSIKQTQAGHGLYDDTTIAVLDPDNIPVEYSDLQVIALPIDDAAIYTQVSAAAESGLILLSDIPTVVGYIQNKAPITSIEYVNELIAQWANDNPYLRSIVISKSGEEGPVVDMKEGDTLVAIATLSNNTTADKDLTYKWTDADSTIEFGSDATLELGSKEVGYRIKVSVEGYRNELDSTTSNAVVTDTELPDFELSDIVSAPLEDWAGEVDLQDVEVNLSVNGNELEVSGEIPEHTNSQDKKASWVGIGIPQPESGNYVYTVKLNNEVLSNNAKDDSFEEDGKNYDSIYFNGVNATAKGPYTLVVYYNGYKIKEFDIRFNVEEK